MEKNSKIYVAGHRGMVGSAIVRELKKQGYENILTRTHSELDLTRQADVEKFFAEEKPEYVFLAAAKVGGIGANSESPADFMYLNMMIEMNVMIVGYRGEIFWDTSKPNGTPRKLLDVSKAATLDWTYKTELRDGIKLASLITPAVERWVA